MGWTAPQPEINNYTREEGINHPGSIGGYYSQWYDEETLAWACNQRDDCAGFIFNKPVGRGGWTFSYSGMRPAVSDARYRSWRKNSQSWRKAGDPDTNVEGVLPKDETQSKITGLGWSGPEDYQIGLGVTTCGSPGYPHCNNMNTYKIPLGWKWMITNEHIEKGTEVEGHWNRANMGWDGQTYSLDRPEYHGMMDRDDSVLAQNIGFDVAANFTSMVSKGVHPNDALKIRHKWCIANTTNINDPKCANFYSTPEANAAGFRYDQDLYYMCKNDPNWFLSSSCRTSINNAVKGTNESIRQQAKDAIAAFCDRDVGRDNQICGCYNVMKYGGACLTSQKTIPGCRQLAETVGDLPAGAQVAFADKFCASDVCVTQALGNSALLPDYTAGKQCPNITQCVQDFRNANFQGSQVDASCKNTVNITGVAPPAPPAAPIRPPPPPGVPPPPPPPPGVPPPSPGVPPPPPGTPAKPGTPPTSGLLWPSSAVPGVDTKEKQFGLIGFLFLFCCCLMLILLSVGDE